MAELTTAEAATLIRLHRALEPLRMPDPTHRRRTEASGAAHSERNLRPGLFSVRPFEQTTPTSPTSPLVRRSEPSPNQSRAEHGEQPHRHHQLVWDSCPMVRLPADRRH